MRQLILAFAAAALLAGCTTKPVLNFQDSPVGLAAQGKVQGFIESALQLRGWQVSARRSGEIDAFIELRTHRADITISYDSDSYSIAYRDSRNLDYRDGMIHRNYNRWVNNLNADIQQAMARGS